MRDHNLEHAFSDSSVCLCTHSPEFSIYRGEYGSGGCSCGVTCLPLDIFVIVLYSWSRLGHMIV